MTTDSQDDRLRKFALFLLGITLPVAGWLLWPKIGQLTFLNRKIKTDQAHDVTVEDSFPASDPPSAW